MSFWVVAWLAWTCPRAPIGLGWLVPATPSWARPIVCSCEPRGEVVQTRGEAVRRARELGSGAAPRLQWCEARAGRALRCWDRPVSWREELVGP